MPLEDFTTFTQVEPDDRIQTTATHVDARLERDEDAYLYKDYGVGHFGDFEHKIDVKSVSAENSSKLSFWALTNDVEDLYWLLVESKTVIYLEIFQSSTTGPRFILREYYGGSDWYDIDTDFAVIGTTYYLLIKKAGTTLTAKIYDTAVNRDAGGAGGLLDTLTLTLQADHSLRYLFVAITYNDGATTRGVDGDIENLDLQEVVGEEHFETVTDILGLADSFTAIKHLKQTAIDILGLSDSFTQVATYHVAPTDILGLTDSYTAPKHMFQTVTETLGLTDTFTVTATYYTTQTDILGLIDTVTTKKTIHVTVTDILGMVDTVPAAPAKIQFKPGARMTFTFRSVPDEEEEA